ncbi:MAG: PPOX class F420-dependent oxidoreductase [Actinobacteria bacterium]|nr:PPOX class F420-dependent oxidoreductase [Actinomycetota bacterium]
MSTTFTQAELDYLSQARRLARIATADAAGRPHVTPVGMWHYNPEKGTIDVTGHDFAATRKYRNVAANPRAALVVDDIASTDPFRPRAVVVEGSARAVAADEEDAAPLIRITPDRIISWGLGSEADEDQGRADAR